jgi:hypothetical protein
MIKVKEKNRKKIDFFRPLYVVGKFGWATINCSVDKEASRIPRWLNCGFEKGLAPRSARRPERPVFLGGLMLDDSKARCVFPSEENLLASRLRSPSLSLESYIHSTSLVFYRKILLR